MQNRKLNNPEIDRFAGRIAELRSNISQINPTTLAINTETIYDPTTQSKGNFKFAFWKTKVTLSFPKQRIYDQNSKKELNTMDQAMILYYFNTADGTPLRDEWVSFSDLQNGMFYNHAFQGYTGQRLASIFNNDKSGFEQTAESLSGHHYPLGSASFSFQILPRISLLVVQWLGDEDFPASFQILFNASANHYMVTDGYAILGSILTHQLIKAYSK